MSLATKVLPRRLPVLSCASRFSTSTIPALPATALARHTGLRSSRLVNPLSQAASFGTSTAWRRKQSAIAQRLPDPERQPQRFRDFDLEGKTFVVTGGGRGLGLTLAEVLVEAGGKGKPPETPTHMRQLKQIPVLIFDHAVYCLDRLSAPVDEFHDCRDRLAELYGGTLTYEKVDVRDAADLDRVISKIADEHDGLHGLVAAAGIQKVVPALEYPPDAINEMMDINYKGVYLASVSCARQMIKHNTPGAICLIASMSGLIANKGFTSSVYNSSKAAVCQMARSLAMEWGKVVDGRPIRVNALCPGLYAQHVVNYAG
jgi:NAD(P)-dependent dehydrogenase (short-subunit alcohol dehydrogenase family)